MAKSSTLTVDALERLRELLRIIAGRELADGPASVTAAPGINLLESGGAEFSIIAIQSIRAAIDEARPLAARLPANFALKRPLQTYLRLAMDSLAELDKVAAQHFYVGSFDSSSRIVTEAEERMDRDVSPHLLTLAAELALEIDRRKPRPAGKNPKTGESIQKPEPRFPKGHTITDDEWRALEAEAKKLGNIGRDPLARALRISAGTTTELRDRLGWAQKTLRKKKSKRVSIGQAESESYRVGDEKIQQQGMAAAASEDESEDDLEALIRRQSEDDQNGYAPREDW